MFVKVRSTRAPQPAWLGFGNGAAEVELPGGEDGVSPGQACVFYDAAEGQARVLGGGIISDTVAFNRPGEARHVPAAVEATAPR
jgi:tRNA-specific 2-thiouridylase